MANSRFRLLQVERGHNRRHQRRLGHLELPELNESCRNEFCVLEKPLDGLILPEKFLLHREVVIAVGDDCDICGFLLRDYK